jgi:hypothetical protein
MSRLAENFLNPSFGKMEDVVHIVIIKYPIGFQTKAHGPVYTSAAGVNGNLR